MRASVFFPVCLGLLVAVLPAKAERLWRHTEAFEGGSRVLYPATFFLLGWGDGVQDPWADYWLFDHVPVWPSDEGETFALTSSDDYDFDAFVAGITNGINNPINFMIDLDDGINSGGGGRHFPESDLFYPEDPSRIDLLGFEITEIRLTVDTLWLDMPGRNPNGDGYWTDYVAKVTYEIHGVPVPEPGTATQAVVLCLGVLGLRRDTRGVIIVNSRSSSLVNEKGK
jgi:hypothetical protein